MADRKISDLTALTTPATGDLIPIVDISEAAAADKNKSITVGELLRGAPDGTAAAPGIAFESDGGNGMFLGGTDILAFSTGGTQAVTIDASQRVGIGTSSPQSVLDLGVGTNGRSISWHSNPTAAYGNMWNAYGSGALVVAHGLKGSTSVTDGFESSLSTSRARSALELKNGIINLYTDAASTVAYGTAYTPTPRLTINSSGNVGIGTTSVNSLLEVRGTSDGQDVLHLSNSAGSSDGGAENQIRVTCNGNTNWGNLDIQAYQTIFTQNGGEKARLDNSGRLLVGTSSARSSFYNTTSSYSPLFQLESASPTNGATMASVVCAGGNAFAGYLLLGKHRGSVGGTPTIVNDDDHVGSVSFQAGDGTNMVELASIDAFVDGTPGADDMPGRLRFSTTSDGASSPTERVRIFANGRLACGRDSRNATFGTDEQFVINGLGYAAFHGLNGSAYLIGQNSNSRDLRIGSGSGYASTGVQLSAGGTSWGTYSDERLKTDIVELADCLESIKDIRCVSYRLADIDEADSKKRLGVIAQDLVGKYDEAINSSKRQEEDDTEYLSVQYTDLIPVLLKALQEATTKIETLEAKVAALEAN